MSYRTDTDPLFKFGFRVDIEQRSGTSFVLVQRHIDSPHNLVWQSEPYPSPIAALRRKIELRAQEYARELRDPLSACPNLGNIAFHIHWSRVAQEGHPSVALGECPDCYGEAELLIRAAAEELDWIKEVHRGN